MFHHWDNFLGSIQAHSFFPFETNHRDMILWFLIVWTPSRFYGSLFCPHLVSVLWDEIVGSKVIHSFLWFVIIGTPSRPCLSLLLLFFLISHYLDTILGSIYIYSTSLLFPIIRMRSRFYLSSFVCSAYFSSLGQHYGFYLRSFIFCICNYSLGLLPLVSHRLETI